MSRLLVSSFMSLSSPTCYIDSQCYLIGKYLIQFSCDPAILIPACASFSLAFLMMYSKGAFSKSSLNIWKFSVHILFKPDLENFEHYFASM